MESNVWYDLDPDHHKKNPDVPHCCRCKKPIKNTMAFENFISVEIHHTHYWVKTSIYGKHLLGSNCAKKLQKVKI